MIITLSKFGGWRPIIISPKASDSESFHIQLCTAMNYSLPGSSVYGILQARMLGWVAMPSSRESS